MFSGLLVDANRAITSYNKKFSILIVENNVSDVDLIKTWLNSQLRFPIISQVSTYAQAKELLAANTTIFDIIILDLSLPDIGGVPLIKKIVSFVPNIPILIISNYCDFNYSVRALSLGISDFFIKDEMTAESICKSIIYHIEKKRYELKTRRIEKAYQEIFDNSPLPTCIINPGTFRFLDVNLAAIAQYGYKHIEFLTMATTDILAAEDIKEIDIQNLRLKNAPFFTSKLCNVQKKCGHTVAVELVSSSIQYFGHNAIMVTSKGSLPNCKV